MKFIKQTKNLISEIDIFWDNISRSALVFRSGIYNYLDEKIDRFLSDLEDIAKLESDTDTMRREIKYKTYQTPDTRSPLPRACLDMGWR